MLKTGREIANAFDSARDEYCDAHLNGWPQRWAGFVSMPISRFHDPDVSNRRPLVVLKSHVSLRFLGVDAFWALCMACNVYLAFFHNYSTGQLRALDWKYLLGCYGASFVPALAFLFVNTRRRGRIYGPAVVSNPWISQCNC